MKALITSLITLGYLFFPLSVYSYDVSEEQRKVKDAVEKAKKPVETLKDLAPSASFLKPDSKSSDPKQASQQQQNQPKQELTVEYVFLGKRDPFMPLIKQETDKKKAPTSPMESFMITDIKLVGILEKNNVYYAQIVLPDGKSFTIKPGQKLGLMGGVVSKITMDLVTIKEKAIDAEGKPIVKEIKLRLQKKEEEE